MPEKSAAAATLRRHARAARQLQVGDCTVQGPVRGISGAPHRPLTGLGSGEACMPATQTCAAWGP